MHYFFVEGDRNRWGKVAKAEVEEKLRNICRGEIRLRYFCNSSIWSNQPCYWIVGVVDDADAAMLVLSGAKRGEYGYDRIGSRYLSTFDEWFAGLPYTLNDPPFDAYTKQTPWRPMPPSRAKFIARMNNRLVFFLKKESEYRLYEPEEWLSTVGYKRRPREGKK